MSRLIGQAALAILGVHPWGRADQLDQAPWGAGPGAREHWAGSTPASRTRWEVVQLGKKLTGALPWPGLESP